MAVLGLACRDSQIEVRTDRRSYALTPADSVAIVRVTVKNATARTIHLQTVDGRIDLGVLIRVDAKGRILVGADTAGVERWSLFHYRKSNSPPIMGVVSVRPDSVLASSYELPRGHYRALVLFGDRPDKLDEHGVWLKGLSIQ